MPISRSQMPRQMYGLGSLVKSIGKTVKKIVKSPIGKAAILGLGAYGLGGGTFFGKMLPGITRGGQGIGGFGGISSILGNVGDVIGGSGLGDKFAKFATGKKGILGAGALAGIFASQGISGEQAEEIKRNPEALRGYLSQYYKNLNKNATDQEVNEFVEANMTEYKADGGRIGYADGSIMPRLNELGSSVSSAEEMLQDINQRLQSAESTLGENGGGLGTLASANMSNANFSFGRPFMGRPALAAFAPALSPLNSLIAKQPGLNNEFLKGGSGGPAGGMQFTLRGGEMGSPLQQAVGMADGGRIGYDDGTNPKKDFLIKKGYGDMVENMSVIEIDELFNSVQGTTTAANTYREPAYMGGRMGYDDGTGDPTYTGNNMEDLPRGLQMDTTTSNPMPAEKSLKENLEFVKETKGGVSPSTTMYMFKMYLDEALEKGEITKKKYNEMLMPFFGEASEGVTRDFERYEEKMANGGRMGFAMGNPEENAVQASGIMDLPLNQNPAGITELDLRETGGFIPPVGVKEKADDIPAMLSNNEFVFTADAVRGMGDGNVNKGAQRMYDMMKKLEKGGRV